MKRLLFFSALMLIGSLCMVSCSDDDDDSKSSVLGTWKLTNSTSVLSKVNSTIKKKGGIPMVDKNHEVYFVFSPGGNMSAYYLSYGSDNKMIKYTVDEGSYNFGNESFEISLSESKISGTYSLSSNSLTLNADGISQVYTRVPEKELSSKLKEMDFSSLAVGTWIDRSTQGTSNPIVLDYKSDGTFIYYNLKLNSDNEVVSGVYRTGTWTIDDEKVTELIDGFTTPTYYTYELDYKFYTQYVWNKLDVVDAVYERIDTNEFQEAIKGVELKKI